MRAKLIVNADDYGFTPGVSAGIRDAHNRGIVTSTSVLAVAPGADADLREARRSCPDLAIGVHLALTGGWKPAARPERVRSLTSSRGRFPSGAGLAGVVARARPVEVLAEWRAQIEAVLDAGVSPDHLDAHHHVAYRSPPLTEVLLTLAADYALPVRLPVPPRSGSSEPGLDVTRLAEMVGASGIGHPEFLLSGFGDEVSVDGLLRLLEVLRPGVVAELGCHPGQVDWRLRVKSSYVRPREAELRLLTDAGVTRWLQKHDVELATFSSLTGH